MIQLKPEVFACFNKTTEGLHRALQTAIELEHSTIPPYLYALYSLNPASNASIYGLISSIVTQEMLHMSLACNILNAIDGKPSIDRPKFIPTYPGPLPGSVEQGLIVGLSGFTKHLVKDTFMVIEEPEDPLNFPVRAGALAAAPGQTIGEFYDRIKKEIIEISKHRNIFKGDPRKQLKVGFTDLIAVTDVDSAVQAINLIVEQGEGTTTSPLDPEDQPAHYYRFAEIYYGKKLIRNLNPHPGEPAFVYGGAPIPFDPKGVTPLVTNPKASQYPANSQAADTNNNFNFTYTSMLKSLHKVFNGHPDRIAPTVELMESMKLQVRYLTTVEVGNGLYAGPSFEYRPVNA
ncbi:MAG TPA: ferritin-like protein [Candidatus Angelobacter sp.]